ncbi:PVC-type heme-binding CxxCH protein [Prosthecobacter sp.]|uniref:PVC-type heme-binding CxxCH protein n=1 Tax=Prosthecobacter sp. TaxID=1965333 RepID=UPI0024890538|nr:PVC-type heme-binding CxxCH protein [Prosthecobacter sp.]MDI1315313.1 c-type cytochrome [Prosthecobacter sp.]
MRHLLLLFAIPVLAADLPPDKDSAIPESGKRPVVITGKASLALPKHDLPDGYTLEVAAASPLVTHPIMGCLDDKGRLFVGDAVGVNWNKAMLEANPPNRVLMLEDTDNDGTFDKSTVFADKMTFPQGACWLNGSLYVGSPPGIWKLTDTDNDGVADQREMIVGGFDYTGNAADIHGPFLHPNGRLYWCHGRKGHKVVQKDGTLVDESLACGIWSCKPDGTDIAWHSLGCGDNPVEVDFTPDGDIIGVQNLYYSQPRGDTLIHWLYGGVYERADQLKAIAHLPRTLETMPVMYNFGHVAVSGSCFWKNYGSANKSAQQFMVTHFNTQRLVRMELTPSGSTYKAVENEFLKLHNPDIHLTDVMEDPRDGSLLLIDTGGWFRIGCPASLMAKSDLLGAIYRIKPKKPRLAIRSTDDSVRKTELQSQIVALKSNDEHARRYALEWVAKNLPHDGEILGVLGKLLDQELDPSSEHLLIYALRQMKPPFHSGPASDRYLSRWLLVELARHGSERSFANEIEHSLTRLDPEMSPPLADAIRRSLEVVPDGDQLAASAFTEWLKASDLTQGRVTFIKQVISGHLAKPSAQSLVTAMLAHSLVDVRMAAMSILAAQTSGATNEAWIPALDKLLSESPTPLVLDAIKKLKTPHFDAALLSIANDTKRPLSIRLKALDSAKSVKLTGETFTLVKGVLSDANSSSAAKIQAAGMIASAPLAKPQLLELAPLFATLGPVELKALLGIVRKSKEPEVGRTFAVEIAKSPIIASQQESAYRTAFSDLPPDIFETVILPAYNTAVAATEDKKRQLGPLADKVITSGNAANGKKHFEMGKGTCIACHKIGEAGRPIGPDLSHIGAIRTERDLLESILFPSNTLARDYEAHVIETSDGQQTLGVIKSHTAEGLLVIDIAGQEKTIAHQTIAGDTTLTNSLMPQGLDQTMPEDELLDLVAWLRSLK